MQSQLPLLSCFALLGLACGDSAPQQPETQAPQSPTLAVPSDSELLLGGQSGDGTGYRPAARLGDDALEAGCDASTTGTRLASLNAIPSELGFSGNDVLDWVQSGVNTSLTWAPDGSLQTAPESGSGRLTIEFETTDAVARLVSPNTEPSSGNEPSSGADSSTCPALLELDVVALVTTPGGNLADRFITTLRAARPSIVSFSGTLNAQELAGELTLEPGLVEGLSSLELNGVLSDKGSFGQLFAVYSRPSTKPLLRNVALWPELGQCSFGGTPLGVAVAESTQVLGRSVRDWQSAVQSLEGLSLRWSDGASSKLSVTTTATDKACLWTDWRQSRQALNLGIDLTTQTQDGRWLALYPGRVEIYSEAEFAPVQSLLVSIEVSASEPELLGVSDLPTAEADRLSLGLRVTLGNNDQPTEGRLRIEARSERSCDENGNGDDSMTLDECLASLRTRVLGASIEEKVSER